MIAFNALTTCHMVFTEEVIACIEYKLRCKCLSLNTLCRGESLITAIYPDFFIHLVARLFPDKCVAS